MRVLFYTRQYIGEVETNSRNSYGKLNPSCLLNPTFFSFQQVPKLLVIQRQCKVNTYSIRTKIRTLYHRANDQCVKNETVVNYQRCVWTVCKLLYFDLLTSTVPYLLFPKYCFCSNVSMCTNRKWGVCSFLWRHENVCYLTRVLLWKKVRQKIRDWMLTRFFSSPRQFIQRRELALFIYFLLYIYFIYYYFGVRGVGGM